MSGHNLNNHPHGVFTFGGRLVEPGSFLTPGPEQSGPAVEDPNQRFGTMGLTAEQVEILKASFANPEKFREATGIDPEELMILPDPPLPPEPSTVVNNVVVQSGEQPPEGGTAGGSTGGTDTGTDTGADGTTTDASDAEKGNAKAAEIAALAAKEAIAQIATLEDKEALAALATDTRQTVAKAANDRLATLG